MIINVLGQQYTVTKLKFFQDPLFKNNECDGYCNEWSKNIIYCDMSTYPGFEGEATEVIKTAEQQTLRHEIVHAFLAESGLSFCASDIPGPWAKSEEIIDWIALQGPKICAAWRQAGALPAEDASRLPNIPP